MRQDQWLAYALHSDDGSCASEEASSLMLLQTSRRSTAEAVKVGISKNYQHVGTLDAVCTALGQIGHSHTSWWGKI